MDLQDERRHLIAGPEDGERPAGVGLVTLVADADDPAAVLDCVREVMTAVLTGSEGPWPSTEAWRTLLPAWFVARCTEEPTDQEEQRWLERWRASGPETRRALEEGRGWTLSAWLSWFEPEERPWSWWSAARSADRCTVQVEVEVEVTEWPVPLGALRWLLRTAGARSVEDDD